MLENNAKINQNEEDSDTLNFAEFARIFCELEARIDYIIKKLKQNGIDIYADSTCGAEVRRCESEDTKGIEGECRT